MVVANFRMMGWLVRATSIETSESSKWVGQTPRMCGVGIEPFGSEGNTVVAGDNGCH